MLANFKLLLTNGHRNKMPGAQFKAVYVPSFGSQSSRCSQKDGQQTNEYLIELSSSRRRQDTLLTKKIKLTKCNSKPALSKKKRKDERRSMPPPRPVIERMTAARSQGEGERSQRRRSPSVGQRCNYTKITLSRILSE